MGQVALVNEEIQAGLELAREFNEVAPVKAAFWLKASEAPKRYLYIALERFDAREWNSRYEEVLRLIQQMQSPYIDLFRVKLIGPDDPLAIAAADLNLRYGERTETRIWDEFFGGISVDDVYLYPKLSALQPIPVHKVTWPVLNAHSPQYEEPKS